MSEKEKQTEENTLQPRTEKEREAVTNAASLGWEDAMNDPRLPEKQIIRCPEWAVGPKGDKEQCMLEKGHKGDCKVAGSK